MVERGEAGKGRRAETVNITKILPEYELAITVIHNSLIYSDSISVHVCETEREKKRKRETWGVWGRAGEENTETERRGGWKWRRRESVGGACHTSQTIRHYLCSFSCLTKPVYASLYRYKCLYTLQLVIHDTLIN